jgi:hypothetical protein
MLRRRRKRFGAAWRAHRALRFAEHDDMSPASSRLWRRGNYQYRLQHKPAEDQNKRNRNSRITFLQLGRSKTSGVTL